MLTTYDSHTVNIPRTMIFVGDVRRTLSQQLSIMIVMNVITAATMPSIKITLSPGSLGLLCMLYCGHIMKTKNSTKLNVHNS